MRVLSSAPSHSLQGHAEGLRDGRQDVREEGRFVPARVRIASGAVFEVRTTSSSGITLAGEKKCMPMMSCGRVTAVAMSSISRVEVLVASTAPGFATLSMAANICFFRATFSNTASIQTSASFASA